MLQAYQVCWSQLGLLPNHKVSFYASCKAWPPRVGNKYASFDAFLVKNLSECTIDRAFHVIVIYGLPPLSSEQQAVAKSTSLAGIGVSWSWSTHAFSDCLQSGSVYRRPCDFG